MRRVTIIAPNRVKKQGRIEIETEVEGEGGDHAVVALRALDVYHWIGCVPIQLPVKPFRPLLLLLRLLEEIIRGFLKPAHLHRQLLP